MVFPRPGAEARHRHLGFQPTHPGFLSFLCFDPWAGEGDPAILRSIVCATKVALTFPASERVSILFSVEGDNNSFRTAECGTQGVPDASPLGPFL